MKVYQSLAEIKENKNSVITVGNFDGVHRGHLRIIERLIQKTRRINGRSVVITFNPHPQTVKSKQNDSFALLTPLKEKIELLENTGIDILLVLHFDKHLAGMKAEDFIINILKEKIGAKYLIIGFNHSFGTHRSGDVNLLQQLSGEHNFFVELVKPYKIDKFVVSSTKIRDLLKKGKVKLANNMLGRNYSLKGTVITGKKFGQQIGFPTANINIESQSKLIPMNGVYAVIVSDNMQKREGTVYIGKCPTLNGEKRMVEIYLHDYNGDLYGKNLKIEFLEYIREEKKFNSIDELKENIKNDINKTKNILSLGRRQ